MSEFRKIEIAIYWYKFNDCYYESYALYEMGLVEYKLINLYNDKKILSVANFSLDALNILI